MEGEVIKQGVLNATVNNAVKTNITCVTGEECPWYGNQKMCGDGYCQMIVSSTIIRDDSFSVRDWDGRVSNVIAPGLKVGEHVKLALASDGKVVEKGGMLWDFQSRYLKGLLIVPLVQNIFEDVSHASREAGWGLLLFVLAVFCWFCVGFLIVFDNILVRILNAFIIVYFILMLFNLGMNYGLFYDRGGNSILLALFQQGLIFLPILVLILLVVLNGITFVKWFIWGVKKEFKKT